MGKETFTLDGLAFSDNTAFQIIDAPDLTPGELRLDWVGGPDSDGDIPLDAGHTGNITIQFVLRVVTQATADLALAKASQLVAKLEETRQRALDLVWVPKDSTASFSLTVRSGVIADLPLDAVGDQIGWLVRAPRFIVTLTCDPFLHGAWLQTITDDFSANTIANYTFDAGAGTLAVSGGQLVPSDVTSKRIYYNAASADWADGWLTWKFTTGAAVTATYEVFLILKRLSATDYLMAGLTSTSTAMRIYTVDAGVDTQKATVSRTISAATSYWLRGRVEGNLVTIEFWTAAPTPTGTPATSLTYTLVGAEATKFGAGVVGKPGLRTIPKGTDWRYDDVTIEPNVMKSTEPVMSMIVAGIAGHVPAEGIVALTDSAAQNRRLAEWGAESRYLNTATALLLDSASLDVTVGSFIGTVSTRTGGYASNGVVRGTLTDQPQAVCGTGNLNHVGRWRIRARLWGGSAIFSNDIRLRFAYRNGDGPYSYTPWVQPATSGSFAETLLGTISLPPASAGTQQWNGRIEAYTTTIGDTLDVDYLLLLPVLEGWGQARGRYSYQSGILTARDPFTAITAGTALNARVAPTGGTWATAGATTDLVAADTVGSLTVETMYRFTVSDSGTGRHAVLGSVAYTDTEVSIDNYATHSNIVSMVLRRGALARYVDSSNYLRAIFDSLGIFSLSKVVGGAVTQLAAVYKPYSPGTLNAWYTIRLVVLASGIAIATWIDTTSEAVIATLIAADPVLATGGTLDDGKPGFIDFHGDANTSDRWYKNFYAATPPFDPVAMYSGRTLEFRPDSTERQNAAGTVYGAPITSPGVRVFLPPAGDQARPTRVWGLGRRNDIEVAASPDIADALTMQVRYRPRYRLPVK